MWLMGFPLRPIICNELLLVNELAYSTATMSSMPMLQSFSSSNAELGLRKRAEKTDNPVVVMGAMRLRFNLFSLSMVANALVKNTAVSSVIPVTAEHIIGLILAVG